MAVSGSAFKSVFSSLSRNLPGLRSTLSRSYSATSSNVSVETDDKGMATLSLNKGPVNSLNVEFMKEIVSELSAVETSGAKGLVLTSGLPTIFCAGLEITEMYKPEEERLREFWSCVQELWIKLYSYKLPLAAAINGHSPAGGCLMAICADYRVMVGPKYTIGLNETLLGIVAPFFFKDSMEATIGTRNTELALMLGKLYKTDEAAKIGLIDQVVADKEEALAVAGGVVKQLMRIPSEARHNSKMMMRQAALDKLSTPEQKQQDIDFFVHFINQDKIQKPLEAYLMALKAKSKKKA